MVNTPIAVTSRSFSKHPILREELIRRYPNVRFNDDGRSLSGDDLIAFCKGCEKAITALEKIDGHFLSALPEIQVISKYGVGTDMLDLDEMIRHGVRLGWTGGVNRRSVSELVVAFSISLLRHIWPSRLEISQGVWRNRIGGCITGRTFGIIGCGHIGKDLVRILRGFDCNILANDILDFPEFYSDYQVRPVGLEELLQTADIVTLHVPLDESTTNLLNRERLALMNQESYLINAARGGIVDEQALKEMLQSGQLAGAAFDVFAMEPPNDLELLSLPNFLATPHIGGSSEEAVLAMGRAAIHGLDANEVPSATHPY